MLAFLRFVFIAIIVIYVLGYIFRVLIRFYIKRMGKRYGWNATESEIRPEGDIRVTPGRQQPQGSKKVDSTMGEYVDYEDISSH